MRFFRGRARIIDMLRPHPMVNPYYMMARFKREREDSWRPLSDAAVWALIDRGVGGWRPGRHRLTGMKRERRVVNAAVRFMPVTRQYNEICKKRLKVRPRLYPWSRRKPLRSPQS